MRTMAYEHIKDLLTQSGVTQAYLAELLGRTPAVITNLFNNDRRLQLEEAEKISERFGVPIDFVLYGNSGGVPVMRVYICGSVPGGLPEECPETYNEGHIYYPIRGNPQKIIALKVRGNSMNNIAADGSYVIVDTSRTNHVDLDGKPVIAYANGECTFKRLYLNPTVLVPDSTDKTHRPIILNGEWRIVGAVVGVINPLT